MKELVFLLEEPSAKIMIQGILYQFAFKIRCFPECENRAKRFFASQSPFFESELVLEKISKSDAVIRYIVFEGKQDLEKAMVRKLQKYKNPDAIFIILRDQDAGNCKEIKRNLQQKCVEADKPQSVVRIACRELESWYLADLKAVEKAFSKNNLSSRRNERKFRNPDHLENPSKELKSLVPEYQKINGSRMIAKFLDIENRRSRSFYHFVNSIKKFFQPLN